MPFILLRVNIYTLWCIGMKITELAEEDAAVEGGEELVDEYVRRIGDTLRQHGRLNSVSVFLF